MKIDCVKFPGKYIYKVLRIIYKILFFNYYIRTDINITHKTLSFTKTKKTLYRK